MDFELERAFGPLDGPRITGFPCKILCALLSRIETISSAPEIPIAFGFNKPSSIKLCIDLSLEVLYELTSADRFELESFKSLKLILLIFPLAFIPSIIRSPVPYAVVRKICLFSIENKLFI